MDEIFQEAHGLKGTFDVVKISLNKPRRYGKNGELLINYDETEYHRRHTSASHAGLQHRNAAYQEKSETDGISEERRENV